MRLVQPLWFNIIEATYKNVCEWNIIKVRVAQEYDMAFLPVLIQFNCFVTTA